MAEESFYKKYRDLTDKHCKRCGTFKDLVLCKECYTDYMLSQSKWVTDSSKGDMEEQIRNLKYEVEDMKTELRRVLECLQSFKIRGLKLKSAKN